MTRLAIGSWLLLLGACRPTTGATLTDAHRAALQDSVAAFLDTYAREMSAPPIGAAARDHLARVYASDVILSTDLAGDTPFLSQSLDSLVPPGEIIRKPPGISETRFEWGRRLVTPLAPGLATVTALYSEHVTDTTGTTTVLPGVTQGIVRNGPGGWRFQAVQSAHPRATHERQAALQQRLAPPPAP